MKTIDQVSEQQLTSIATPNHGKRYAVITYDNIINEVKRNALKHGIEINNTIYRQTLNGAIVTAQYFLTYGNDPDIKLMFAWTNSYNKMRKFSCGVGTYVTVCLNGMLTADYSTFSRKHIGSATKTHTAFQEMVEQIEEQFNLADTVFNKMVTDKNKMINKKLREEEINELLGKLFMEDVVGTIQMNIIKKQLKSPSFTYSGDVNSLWHFYNHVTLALKEEHPISFDMTHHKFHKTIQNSFLNASTALVINTDVEIAEPSISVLELYSSEYKVEVTNSNYASSEELIEDSSLDTLEYSEEQTSIDDSYEIAIEEPAEEVTKEVKEETKPEEDILDWLNL